jgi:hypothetical protein
MAERVPSEPGASGGATGALGGPGGTPPSPPPPAAAAPVSRARRIWVQVIIWGTSLLAVLAIFAIWANREMLNPGNWSDTSSQLLQNAEVREATINYLVDQLYANVDVEEELKKRLPTNVQALAGPLAGGLRGLATQVGNKALENARVQEAWKNANKAADEALVAVVKGEKGALAFHGGVVTLDLSTVLKNITERLGLPDVSSKLPPSVAQLKILKSNQIKAVQEIGKLLKGVALILTILVPLLYALAILLARGYRRRTLMSVGIAAVSVGVLVLVLRNVVISQVTDSLVKNESVKPAVHSVMSIATLRLSEIAGAFVVIGIPLIAAAWFAGPARWAVRGRKAIAPFLRDRPEWTYAIVGAIMLLIFIWNPIPSTGKVAGIIVYLALAFFGTYLLRRQTAQEFPATGAPRAPTAPAS